MCLDFYYNKLLFLSQADWLLMNLKIKPNSSKNEVLGLYTENHKNYLKINIKAQAIDGKANKELIGYLSKLLNIPKSLLEIKKGEESSYKQVLIKKQATKEILETILALSKIAR
jgi:uncharacterized protein (TIGR00251 family)